MSDLLTKSIVYADAADFSFDASKIEIVGGLAQLKLTGGPEVFNEDFANDTGFTYNATISEFTGGLVRQKDLRPAGSPTFGATYTSNINGNWGNGVLTGTGTGSPTVSGGKLDLKGFGKYVDYAAAGNANNGQVGAVRFRFTPNYSTKPVGGWNIFFTICQAPGVINNQIEFRQSPSAGQLQLRLKNSSGGALGAGTYTQPNWAPVAGTEYEMEYNWDHTSGACRILINGVTHSTFTAVGTRGTGSTLLRVGADYNAADQSDGEYNDFVVFPAVQHTANYTPGYTVPETVYSEDGIVLPVFTASAPLQTLDDFLATSGGAPRYTLKIDAGTYQYWTGSAWAASDGTYAQASAVGDIDANIGTFPGIVGGAAVTVRVHTPSGNTQASVSDLSVFMSSDIYPLDNPAITELEGVNFDQITDFAEIASKTGSDEVKYVLRIGGQDKYWSGSAWVNSDGTYAQSNTATEIAANASALSFTEGIGAEFKLKALLHSDDGSTTPTLTKVALGYSFAAGSPEIEGITIVHGVLKEADNDPVIGERVRAELSEQTVLGSVVYPRGHVVETTTDENGYWQLLLVPADYQVTIGVQPAVTVTVPDDISKPFKDLL